MKSIKELYEDAKQNKFNITAYKEGVEEVSSTSPFNYLTNTEYIISSSIGLDTLNTFLEKFGLPMPGIKYLLEACEKACKLCKQKGLDSKKYDELVTKVEGYKDEHCYCNALYEDTKINADDGYLAFYEKAYTALKEGKKLNIDRILSRFGEAVVPDLILAHSKCNKLEVLKEGFMNQSTITDPTFHQWLMECMREFNVDNFCYEKTLEGRVESHKKRMEREFAEKVITEGSELVHITESDIDDIQNLINFKEYATTFIRESEIKSLSDEVYNFYETFYFALDDEVKEDVADSVIPNLPNANNTGTIVKEDNLSGKIPAYLKKSAGIEYGEEDTPKSPKDELKEYERPSRKIKEEDLIDDSDDEEEDKEVADPEEVKELKDEIKNADTKQDKQQAINNYYYYTYTHSFNTDKSTNTNTNSPNASINTGNKSNGKEEDSKSSSTGDSSLKEAASVEETDEDIDKDMPTTSLQDTMTDVDRALAKTQQKAKKVVQGFINVGSTFLKPFKRTAQWVSDMVQNWKNADDNKIKERLSNPHERSALLKAIKYSIIGGALFKAGLLLNPIFLFLAGTKKISNMSKEGRLRNELISELKNELEVIDEKIKDADHNDDNKAKYRLMRIKNEIKKKLLRVGLDMNGGHKGREIF